MTLDEAKQKILDRVLAVGDGVTIDYRDFYTSGSGGEIATHTYARASVLSFPGVSVLHETDSRKPAKIVVQRSSDFKTHLITSDEYPQLLEWWDRAEKASAEQRVIQFAESLP